MCDEGEQNNVFLTHEYIAHLYDYNPEFGHDGEPFRSSAQNKSQEQLDDIAKEETDYSSKNEGNQKNHKITADDGNEWKKYESSEYSLPNETVDFEKEGKPNYDKEQKIEKKEKNLCQQKSVKSQNGYLGRKREMNKTNESEREMNETNESEREMNETNESEREMNETNKNKRNMNKTNKNERNRNNLKRRDNLRKKYIDWLRKNWKIKKNPNSNADKSLSEQQKKLNNVLDKIVEELKISPYLFNDERLDEKTFLLVLLSESITEDDINAFLEKCTNEKNEKLDDETLKKFGIKYGMVGFKEYLKDKLSEENLKIYLETAEKVIEDLPSYMENHKKEKKMFTTSKSSE